MKDELDRQNVGGVEFQTRVVLDKVRKSHEDMMRRMESMNEQRNKTVAGLNGGDEFFFINSHDEEDDVLNELLQDEREEGQQHAEEGQREEVGQQQYNTTVEGLREEVGQQHANVSDNESSIQYDTDTYPHEYIEANYTDISSTSSSDTDDRPATPVTERSVRQATPSPQQQRNKRRTTKKVGVLSYHGKT